MTRLVVRLLAIPRTINCSLAPRAFLECNVILFLLITVWVETHPCVWENTVSIDFLHCFFLFLQQRALFPMATSFPMDNLTLLTTVLFMPALDTNIETCISF